MVHLYIVGLLSCVLLFGGVLDWEESEESSSSNLTFASKSTSNSFDGDQLSSLLGAPNERS